MSEDIGSPQSPDSLNGQYKQYILTAMKDELVTMVKSENLSNALLSYIFQPTKSLKQHELFTEYGNQYGRSPSHCPSINCQSITVKFGNNDVHTAVSKHFKPINKHPGRWDTDTNR